LERSGSAAVVAPEPPPPPPPPPEPDPLPAMAAIVLDSTPSGAKVIELVEGKEGKNWGKTPASIAVPGSAEPRRFKLVLRGYGDSVVEVVPNRARIEFTQPLIKGATKP